jgi:hypothetical protein
MVFTEQGIAMLSSVLHSEHAINVNIAIMRAFVKLRSVLNANRALEKKLQELEGKYEGRFRLVFNAIKELMSDRKVPRKRVVGFKDSE